MVTKFRHHGKIKLAVIAVILAGIFFTSGCSTFVNNRGDYWLGQDKLYHFTASGIVGAGATAAALNNGISRSDAPVIGISMAFGVGAGKEYYDATVKRSYWSWKDMVWDIMGGAAGSYVVLNNKK